MGFNRFTRQIVALSLSIALIGLLMMHVWQMPEFTVAKFTVSALWLLLIYVLINYVNQTNRNLSQFLKNLRYSDYLNSDSTNQKSLRELNLNLNEILRYVRLADLEKASTHEYMRQLLNELPTGIISTNETGKVEIINQTALHLLEIDELQSLNQLDVLHQNLAEKLNKIPSGNKKLYTLNTKVGKQKFLFKHVELLINKRQINVFTIENIHSELSKEENLSWQKVFRVLTHEIMNSIAPIRSLTNSLLRIFKPGNAPVEPEKISHTVIETAITALESIDNRNKGLSRFVDEFKQLMRIPEPKKHGHAISTLIKEYEPILTEICAQKNIALSLSNNSVNNDVYGDKEQIGQVLINLVKNAADAINNAYGKIDVLFNACDNCITIQVIDNGIGINEEQLEQIFIPFYSTKENGTGVGLSFSRQVILNHGGEINVHSNINDGTTFEIRLPLTT